MGSRLRSAGATSSPAAMQPSLRRSAARSLVAAVWLVAALLAAAVPAVAAPVWTPCGEAPGVECATVAAPLDYDRPLGDTLDVHVARVPAGDPAHRIGTLLFNFGGPGADVASSVEAFGRALFPALSARYD